MSHRATNWAMGIIGLRPAEKLLLLCLADRHNPDMGCFPDQATLARDSCMSRSAVNDNLARLEAAGLIRRVQRLDPRTRRQRSTCYILGFELAAEARGGASQEPPQAAREEASAAPAEVGTDGEQAAGPCPDAGHGPCRISGRGPCPDSGQSRVRIPDTNPVREPVRREEDPPYPPSGPPRRRRRRPEDEGWEAVERRWLRGGPVDGAAQVH